MENIVNAADGTSEKEAANAIGFGLKLAQSTRMTRPEPHYIHIGEKEIESAVFKGLYRKVGSIRYC